MRSERTLVEPPPPDGSHDQVTMTASAAAAPHPGAADPPSKTRHKPIISFTKRMDYVEAQAARHAGEPDSWFNRKAMVGIVLALAVWAYYVVIGRVCAPMIQQRENAGGSLGQGVGLLIGFNVLWLMFMWTYLKLILTDPGFAKKHLELATQDAEDGGDALADMTPGAHASKPQTIPSASAGYPRVGADPAPSYAQDASPSSVAGMYSASAASGPHTDAEDADTHHGADPDADLEEDAVDRAGTLDGLRNMWPAELPAPESFVPGANDTREAGTADPVVVGTGAPAQPDFYPSEPRHSRGHTIASAHTALSSTGLIPSDAGGPHNTYAPSGPRAPPADSRARGCWGTSRPRVPPQDLEWPFPPTKLGRAWCQHCQIWKPDRAHHCRHCGQCVLAMDHHCPWVGQCVGWNNRKFFVIFCGWSTLFTAYLIAVLVATMAKRTSVDGQMIALAAIAGFFTIFTVMMTLSQVQLMATALTTIESYAIRSQRDRERAALAAQYGFCGYARKIKAKRRWQREWGDMATEGNRWWTGGWGREIKQVMGESLAGWFLPLGRPMGDGMTYQQNPRFGPGGIRRKREEWPEPLR